MKKELGKDWEKHVSEFFPKCPFCDEKPLDIDIKFGQPFDHISCPKCNAKWEINWKGEDHEIESITLIHDNVDNKGKTLLSKAMGAEFWKKLGLSPDKKIAAEEIAREEEAKLREIEEYFIFQRRRALVQISLLALFGLVAIILGYTFHFIFAIFGVMLLLTDLYLVIQLKRASGKARKVFEEAGGGPEGI